MLTDNLTLAGSREDFLYHGYVDRSKYVPFHGCHRTLDRGRGYQDGIN